MCFVVEDFTENSRYIFEENVVNKSVKTLVEESNQSTHTSNLQRAATFPQSGSDGFFLLISPTILTLLTILTSLLTLLTIQSLLKLRLQALQILRILCLHS